MAVALTARRLFSAASEEMVENALVVVGGDGRIIGAGRRADVAIPQGTEVVDFQDATIIPGLIDMHSHVMHMLSASTEEATLTIGAVTTQVIHGVNHVRQAVATGVTTLRDVAAPGESIFQLRRAINKGVIPGPRIFASGRAITMTGGHAWNLNCVQEADGPDEVRRVAREQLRAGADWLKLMATGGAGTDGERIDDVQMTADEMRAAVEEAHKKGKFVAAHATATTGALQAIEAGVDSIEHGVILDKNAVTAMARKGVYYCPTLDIYRLSAERGAEASIAPHQIAKAQGILDSHKKSFQAAMAAGVKIVTGTDSGGGVWPFADVAGEVAQMVRMGMSPAAGLIAATRTPAECLGQADHLGTVQQGRWGDLLVVAGNPLEDIGLLKRVLAVFKGGQRQSSLAG
jgi:imidazolonepropionase-like amidohydrolase